MVGRSCGVRPTASAREKRNDSSTGRRRITFTTKIPTTSVAVTRMRRKPKRRRPSSNDVGTCAWVMLVPKRPNSVCSPTAAITAVPVPLATWVPHHTAFVRSLRPVDAGSSPGCFSTGKLSPVSVDWSRRSASESSTRASAAITPPARSTRTSPGTTSSRATLASTPSRITVAWAGIAAMRSSTARSAPRSCTYPRTALATVISKMMLLSMVSPSAIDNTAAPMSYRTIGFSTWRRASLQVAMRLGTCRRAPVDLDDASPLVSPVGREESRSTRPPASPDQNDSAALGAGMATHPTHHVGRLAP